MLNEKELILACKRNEYSAQLQVYHNYKNMMLNSSFRIVGSREEAEDIVQESFLSAFEKIGQLNESVSLGGWLKRIAINRSLDQLRKEKRMNWLDNHESYMELKADDQESDIDLDVKVEEIKREIQNLPEKYRTVLVLYLIEDYNLREIAEMFEIKESTVRNQYSRGKRKLIKALKAKEPWI